jgi:hypothetical protein
MTVPGDTAQFEDFIGSPEIRGVLGDVGAHSAPTVTVARAEGFPGEF